MEQTILCYDAKLLLGIFSHWHIVKSRFQIYKRPKVASMRLIDQLGDIQKWINFLLTNRIYFTKICAKSKSSPFFLHFNQDHTPCAHYIIAPFKHVILAHLLHFFPEPCTFLRIMWIGVWQHPHVFWYHWIKRVPSHEAYIMLPSSQTMFNL